MSAEPKPSAPAGAATGTPAAAVWGLQRLRQRLGSVVAQGVLWTTGGYGVSQILRLANNLIMTRLLNPEAFGLMAIVDTLMIGLYMASDTGVSATLVQRRDAPQRELLDTAWSIQALRGLLLCAVMAGLAAPLAHWYDEPMLFAMLAVSSTQLIFEGFQSTGIFEAARAVAIRRLVLFELVVQVSAIACMLSLAWVWPSVWALVWGGLAASVVRLLASHWMFPRRHPRMRWSRECVRELVHFGRWLLPSTFLLFVIMRSDRLLLGKWLSVADLGTYAIACFVPLTVIAVAGQVSHNVLFPVFARMKERGLSPLRGEFARRRLAFMAFTIPVLSLVAAFGDSLVALLYDSRYQEAGWMVRVLSCGAIVACANESALAALLGLGDVYRRFVALLVNSVLFVAVILAGGALAGRLGLVIGVAAAPALAYPMVSWALWKHRAWTPRLDAAAFAGAIGAIALLIGLRRLLET